MQAARQTDSNIRGEVEVQRQTQRLGEWWRCTDRLGERWGCRDRHRDWERGGGAETDTEIGREVGVQRQTQRLGERWRCTDRHIDWELSLIHI